VSDIVGMHPWPVISRLARPARGVVTRLSSAVLMGYTGDAARGVRPFRRLWSWIVSVAEVDKQRVAIAPAGEESVDPWVV
jgi:hypothetical protein